MTAEPLAVLHDQFGLLGASLAQWENREAGAGTAADRRAASAAVGAIDAMLRELYQVRGRLVREVSTADAGLLRQRQDGAS